MPRLGKGQIAPSIKVLSEAAARSAACRISEFDRIRTSPSPSKSELSAFISVSKLAAWDDESLGITPLSHKTLRKYVNGLYEGGLSQLLRDAALVIGDTRKLIRKKPSDDVDAWRLSSQLAVDAALDMSARYLDLLERLKRLSLRSDIAESELQRHYRRYEKNPHIKVVKMTSVGRLWRTSSKEFYLPGYDKFRRSERWAAPEMRVMYWPDGCICWQLNVYFLHLRRSNSAISTINTYASELSLFVRFLFESKVVIEDVCDDVLVSFSDWLVNRKKSSGNHINRILLRVISFLEWYQTLLVGRRLVGSLGQGAQVTISLRSLKSKQGVVRVRTQHHAMVPASIPRTVRPISSNIVSALLDSCEWAAKTNFRRSRDRCMLVLLADTGIRREELTWIRVSDVVGASADRKLPVRTSKRKGNPYRLIPISDETFRMLLEYIDVTRSIQVRRLNRRKIGFKDQGWLFCTREGFKMAP